MSPWKVSVGMTMVVIGVGAWLLLEELAYLQPYGAVIASDYGVYLAAYGGMALVTQAAAAYLAARVIGLGAVGRKVDVVERAIRRGDQDPELADALARDAAGDYS